MFPNPRRRFSRLQIKVISAKSNKTTCINLFKQRRRMKSFNFIPVYHGTFFIYGQLSWDLWEHIHKENILNKFVVGITQKQKLTTQKRKEKFVGNNENVIAAGFVLGCVICWICFVTLLQPLMQIAKFPRVIKCYQSLSRDILCSPVKTLRLIQCASRNSKNTCGVWKVWKTKF